MTRGSWPLLPGQCPDCAYLHDASPAFVDDSGYEIVGFCRHPRIAMELFRPQAVQVPTSELCPLFVRRARPSPGV